MGREDALSGAPAAGDALVLFAHGARDPRWSRTVDALAERVARRAPGLAVRTAFLEFMQPDLPGAVDALVAAGATRVRIAPVFLAAGGHVLHDLPALVDACAGRHPGVAFEVLPVLGALPEVLDAMAAACTDGPASAPPRPTGLPGPGGPGSRRRAKGVDAP